MAKDTKVQAVAEIKELFLSSSAVFLTEYRGLSVPEVKELRVALGNDVTYAVVKNTLTKIAARDAKVEGLDEGSLKGPTAIAFVGSDPVAATKALTNFAKAHEALVIKGGLMDGLALQVEDVKKLASLESREVLLAKVAGGVKAGMAKAAFAFNAVPSKAIRTVDALRLKQEV